MYHDEDEVIGIDDFENDPFLDMDLKDDLKDDLDEEDFDTFGTQGKKGVDPDSISEDDML